MNTATVTEHLADNETGNEANATTSPCAIVLGDLDYVADSTLIRRHYDDEWPQWQGMAEDVLQRAKGMPQPWASLYARGRGLSERELLLRLVQQANRHTGVNILLHHFDNHAAGPALAACSSRPLLSYASGESWTEASLRELLASHCPRLVVQPVDDGGIPATAEERLHIVERIWRLAADYGMKRSDLYVDVLSLAQGQGPCPASVSVQTCALATSLGFSSIAWPANVGLGHAQRQAMAAAFAAQLVHAGLRLAVIASRDQALLEAVAAANALRTGFSTVN